MSQVIVGLAVVAVLALVVWLSLRRRTGDTGPRGGGGSDSTNGGTGPRNEE